MVEGKTQATVLGGWTWNINANCKNPKAAYDLISYLNSESGDSILAVEGKISARKDFDYEKALEGYGLTRYYIIGSEKIKMAVLMTRMFPGILLCIPFYIIMKQLQLIDSYVGLIMMYCSFTLPFAIWNTCAFFNTIPWELEEAAMIDGCGRLRSFFAVIVHVAKPGLFVTALFCFMSSWDEYMYASIFINTTLKKTIQVGMQDFVGQYSVDWGLLMSAVVISLIPLLLFFALVQKNLVDGLSSGAVKG